MPDQLRIGIENWRTTAAGAGLAGLVYAGGVGGSIPHTTGEWIVFGISVLIQLLAVFAKDAATGSRP